MAGTLFSLLQESVMKYPSLAVLREIDAEGQARISTFAELYTRVKEVGTGLIDLGLEPGQKVPVIAEPGGRWMTANLAVLGCRGVVAAADTGLATQALEDLLVRCQPPLVIAANRRAADRVLALRRRLKKPLRSLRKIVLLSAASEENRPGVWRLFSFPIFSWDEVQERGCARMLAGDHRFDLAAAGLAPQDTASCYHRPGDQGTIQEIALTHDTILRSISVVQKQLGCRPGTLPPYPRARSRRLDARWLSTLPIGHPAELFIQTLCLHFGNTLLYGRPEAGRVLQDLKREQPDCLVAPSRLLEELAGGVAEHTRIFFLFRLNELWQALVRRLRSAAPPGPLLRRLSRALTVLAGLLALLPARLACAAQVRKVQRQFLGGRLETVIGGDSPLAPRARRFYNGMGIRLLQSEAWLSAGQEHAQPIDQPAAPASAPDRPPAEPPSGAPVPHGAFAPHGSAWQKLAPSAAMPPARLASTRRPSLASGGPSLGLLEERLRESPWVRDVVLQQPGEGGPKFLILPRLDALRGYASSHGISWRDDPDLLAHPEILRLFQREITLRAGRSYPLECTRDEQAFRRVRSEERLPPWEGQG